MSIPCIVISSGIRNRYSNLLNKLQDSRFSLSVIDAIVPVKKDEDFFLAKIHINTTKFETYYGRKPLIGELGCSAAHNLARKLASLNQLPSIIFEDDARILDVDELIKIYNSFSMNREGVLNLSFGLNRKLSRKALSMRIYRVPTPAPLAVAYILDPHSAGVLVDRNSNLDFVADWPDSKVKNYILSSAIVNHGDELTLSTIDEKGLRHAHKVSRVTLYLQIFSFYYFFRNFSNFENVYQYYRIFMKPRIHRYYIFFLKIYEKMRGF